MNYSVIWTFFTCGVFNLTVRYNACDTQRFCINLLGNYKKSRCSVCDANRMMSLAGTQQPKIKTYEVLIFKYACYSLSRTVRYNIWGSKCFYSSLLNNYKNNSMQWIRRKTYDVPFLGPNNLKMKRNPAIIVIMPAVLLP